MSERTRRRWPSRVFDVGEEPDPRFTFANERTFLAWIRTSVALLAAGIALDAFVEDVPAGPRRACAGILIVLGIVCSVAAYRRWMTSERALRLGQPLPPPALAPVLAYTVAACGLLAALLVLFQR
jgi:putative membrane protein